MNIFVLLHPVRDPASFTVNRKAQKIFTHRDEYLINPADKNALEAALRLGGTVTAIALGQAPADDVVRQARALGAARAVRIDDPALAQADASVRVTVLERLVTHLGGADLILFGAEVLDADLAQVGPRLAQALDWPFLADAHDLALAGPALKVILPHQGRFHQAETDLPAVVAVARDSNQPRYAHGRDILNAFKAKDAVEVLTLADLQLTEADLQPLVDVRGESFPPERELGRKLEGSAEDMARQVLDVMRRL